MKTEQEIINRIDFLKKQIQKLDQGIKSGKSSVENNSRYIHDLKIEINTLLWIL